MLVVELAGFNDVTFLDATGLPHSDEMRTVERIRKIGNQLEDIITIHDPGMYARDWQARFVYDSETTCGSRTTPAMTIIAISPA